MSIQTSVISTNWSFFFCSHYHNVGHGLFLLGSEPANQVYLSTTHSSLNHHQDLHYWCHHCRREGRMGGAVTASAWVPHMVSHLQFFFSFFMSCHACHHCLVAACWVRLQPELMSCDQLLFPSGLQPGLTCKPVATCWVGLQPKPMSCNWLLHLPQRLLSQK
jgi:hypothetical protein